MKSPGGQCTILTKGRECRVEHFLFEKKEKKIKNVEKRRIKCLRHFYHSQRARQVSLLSHFRLFLSLSLGVPIFALTAEDDFSAWLIIRQHLVVWRNCERILFTMGLIIVSNQNKKRKRKKNWNNLVSPDLTSTFL